MKSAKWLLLSSTTFFLFFNVVFGASIGTSLIVSVVPNAPSDLSAVAAAPTQVTLSWTDNSTGEDGFSIERKTGSGGSYAEIDTTGPNIATYVDNAVSPSTDYFYRVRTFIDATFSPYSNEASTTTPSAGGGGGGGGGGGNGGGGGGGGGGGYFPPPPTPGAATNVVIEGSAYPLSKVTVLKDGQVAIETISGPDANFSATIGDLGAGSYTFSVYAQDDAGRRSTMFTFPVMLTKGATTIVSGIFLSPTIDVDKDEVRKGDTLVIFGKAVPNAPVIITIHSAGTKIISATSSPSGAYLYDLSTASLAYGSHTVQAQAVQGPLMSDGSFARAFTVGTQNVSASQAAACAPNVVQGDTNGDCRVSLVDFSILAYWYSKPNPPSVYDLNDDGKIDLVDFSIMAYYWTG